MPTHNFTFKVDVNVINHLGVGLYSSTPAALTELVANAWDADATEVKITIDPKTQKITIEDDGHGMTAATLQDKFLNVGYSRRKLSTNKAMSDSGKRYVMGRKGIGKLAMFALADQLQISSKAKNSPAVGIEISVPAFRKSLEKGKVKPLKTFTPDSFPKSSGTKIVLTQVLKSINTTEGYLRTRLARRFSVIENTSGFKIILNGVVITKLDRGFYGSVQFLWAFDKPTSTLTQALTPKLASLPNGPNGALQPCVQLLPNFVGDATTNLRVTGYIASVFKPRDLGSKDDTANMLSVFANRRVFAENILGEISSAKYYQNYLVGEIHADFLDQDDVDRATASREAIKKDDPKYQALISFLRSTLEQVGDKWDQWRSDLGLDKTDSTNAVVLEWLETLSDGRDRKAAERLMTSIKNSQIHPSDQKNEEAQGVLYRGAIVAFEKLRVRKQLALLDNVVNVLSPEFAAIFASLDNLEEASYADITRQRLAVIERFAQIANNPAELEKVAQKYLFDHLWLLDPSWDRVSGRAAMEKTLTKYLKAKNPDSTGARLDISYRASSGRHIIVELKKPSLTSLKFTDLYEQVRKYKISIAEYYKKEEPNKDAPPIDIYVLIAKTPTDFAESDRVSLTAQSGRIITYSSLINDARNAYQEYLTAVDHISPLEKILQRLP